MLEDRVVLSTFTVTSSADDVTQNHTLRYAVANAQSGDTILLTAAIKDPIVLTHGELVVSQNVTIAAPSTNRPTNKDVGIVISGDGTSRVFEVAAGATVTLENLILTQGNGVADNPVGIFDYYDYQGGAILNLGTLTVIGSTFGSNEVGTYNGDLFGLSVGGAIENLGNLTVNNSTFVSNVAWVGGAIENNGTLAVSNSVFEDNSATSIYYDYGGCIDNNGTLSVANTSFVDNECDNHGGGIFNKYGATATVTGCYFTGNHVPYGYGGCIDNNGTLTVTSSTLSGNKTNLHGGGIYNDGSATISDCMLSNGNASYGAGLDTGYRGWTTLIGCTLSNNAGIFGGAIHNDGTLMVTDSTLSGNAAVPYFGEWGYGGAIYNEAGSVTVTDSTLSDNSAALDGGAIYNLAALSIGTSVFTGNTPDNIVGAYTDLGGNTGL
jgi:hypothetical protein